MSGLILMQREEELTQGSGGRNYKNAPAYLGANVVGILDGLVATTFVPVRVAVVAHKAAHIVRAVLRGRPRFAKLAHCVGISARRYSRYCSINAISLSGQGAHTYFMTYVWQRNGASSTD